MGYVGRTRRADLRRNDNYDSRRIQNEVKNLSEIENQRRNFFVYKEVYVQMQESNSGDREST